MKDSGAGGWLCVSRTWAKEYYVSFAEFAFSWDLYSTADEKRLLSVSNIKRMRSRNPEGGHHEVRISPT